LREDAIAGRGYLVDHILVRSRISAQSLFLSHQTLYGGDLPLGASRVPGHEDLVEGLLFPTFDKDGNRREGKRAYPVWFTDRGIPEGSCCATVDMGTSSSFLLSKIVCLHAPPGFITSAELLVNEN